MVLASFDQAALAIVGCLEAAITADDSHAAIVWSGL
jgi:hypothetical protein